ncbi:MAG TPA: GNAT family N-acetyltransferase [Thermomicrobiales bacterium]|nr:GNAT family N-acetyltransferase [Thermomicrobiales bacterium]
MPSAELVVRPPATEREIDAFFNLAAAHFVRDAPRSVAAADLRRSVTTAPGADPAGMRGAFRGGDFLGGYLIETRRLRVGRARLPAGCVGCVITHPDHRRQGVASALMRDAVAYGRERGIVLLLLHGLADFYRPFGYVDVFDQTQHTVRRDDVLALPRSPYRVRPAAVDDAAALWGLYERHYGPHPGSFDRTLDRQAFEIRISAAIDPDVYRQADGAPHHPPMIATDRSGVPRGYLVAPWGSLRAFGGEIAADDAAAAIALLQWRAALMEAMDQPPVDIALPLPPDSLAASFLADACAVESRARHRPWAGWEASPVDLPGLARAMAPEWNARWLAAPPDWSGSIALTAGDEAVTLRLDGDGVACDASPDAARDAILPHATLLPLLFGFRTVAWAAARADHPWPAGLTAALERLFPPVTPWIAPTDGC